MALLPGLAVIDQASPTPAAPCCVTLLNSQLPLIRAREALRDSATPNSSAQRYINAAFR